MKYSDAISWYHTCTCSWVVNTLGHHMHGSVTCLRSHVHSSVQGHPPSTKEFFLIIPTYMMNREIIPSRKKQVQMYPL